MSSEIPKGKRSKELELLVLDGSSTSIFDSVTLGLANQIESVFDDCKDAFQSGRATIEVEGRIGTLKDGERIRIPVDSEVLLVPASTYNFHFESGVSSFQFDKLRNHLEEKLEIDGINRMGEEFQPNQPTKIETHDEIFDVHDESFFNELLGTSEDDDVARPTRSVRVSYLSPKQPNGNPIEILFKDRLLTLNLYTGRDPDEGMEFSREARGQVDIRFAVNVEYKISQKLPKTSKRVNTRQRSRISYPVSGKYRVDTTTVVTIPAGHQHSLPATVHEIEVEMNPKVLQIEIDNKRAGRPHHLYHLVRAWTALTIRIFSSSSVTASDFLGVLRGFSAFLNSSTSSTLIAPIQLSVAGGDESEKKERRQFADLAECKQTQESLQTYLHFVSPVVPIIGDYLFRAVAPQRQVAGESAVTDSDVVEAMKIELTPEEKKALQEKLG